MTRPEPGLGRPGSPIVTPRSCTRPGSDDELPRALRDGAVLGVAISRAEVDGHVLALAAAESVGSRAAGELVGAAAAVEGIVTVAARQGVGTVASAEQVVAALAVQPVGAVLAEHDVRTAGDSVGAAGADGHADPHRAGDLTVAELV